MKVAYIDTSVFVAVLFEEQKDKHALAQLELFDECVTSFLTEAELYSVCKREKVELDTAKSILNAITFIGQESSLAIQYRSLFEMGHLRGADAFHLATALYLSPKRNELTFFSLDQNQIKIAQKLGFKVLTE